MADLRTLSGMSSSPNISACGFCTACGTVHTLGEGDSRRYALELMEQLEEHQRINELPPLSGEKYPPRPAGTPPKEGNLNNPFSRKGSNLQSPIANPKFSTDYLWGDARGQMFGVLECKDSSGNTVVLKAFSCQYNGEWLIDGWAPPLFDVEAFHQLTRPVYKEIAALGKQIEQNPAKELIEQRAALSRNLMVEIHNLYRLTNFAGETKSFHDILGKRKGIPVGTGDCCAPKLLNLAARRGLKPVGLSEFYWGRESKSGARQHKQFYPACADKCQPILSFMLCGTEDRSDGVRESWSMGDTNPTIQYSDTPILHYDNDIVVVCKPSGLLSVPGKGPENQDCVTARIKAMFPNCPDHPEVHRLDMDTSGLMVLALTADAQRELSRQFHDRETGKRYVALLDGELSEDSGTIELPFRLDVDNRPMQIYDPVHGKTGVTRWQKISVENGKTRVEFFPITGRTHQLRVHSASEHGLGIPIIGDRLYGTGTAPGQLKLHASYLSFTHPRTGKKMEFSSAAGF